MAICLSVGGMVAPAEALEMTAGQRAELERLARSHMAPAREVRRAQALLWATNGVSNAEIARRCASTPKSVRRWRIQFAAEGTAAVGRIRAGRSRPAVLCDDVVESIVHGTLHPVPEDGSACWSTGSMAARYRIGKDAVVRIWQARRIRPWRWRPSSCPQTRALRLDQTRRRDPRQSRPQTSHPRPDHQIRDTPLGGHRYVQGWGPQGTPILQSERGTKGPKSSRNREA